MATTAGIGAILVAVLFFDLRTDTPPRDAFRVLGIALIFSACVGELARMVVPRVAPAIWRRFPAPFNWIVLAVALIPVSVIGSLVATALLVATGLLPVSGFIRMFVQSAQVAPVVTLTFGVMVSAYEMMRSQLEQTTLALRTKERDEAAARHAATEARLASLESRVQPHFLFNTLNSIAALIPGNPAGAERMVTQLAALLRSSLDGGSSALVPLEAEVANVRAYLEIERVRLGDRVRFDIRVPPDLAAVPVPRLSLQTLVENSVKYAVAPRREGATILVHGERRAGRLRVTVEDDGPGFDTEAVQSGHGLALLRDRLLLLYGGGASLQIHAAPGGSQVALDLPAASAVGHRLVEESDARLHR